MTETDSAARRRRRIMNQPPKQPENNDYKLDDTMVLLIGLKPHQCDTKSLLKFCDREIGSVQLVTIHSVDSLDMSKEYIKQYKDDGRESCAVVLFRSYKQNYKNHHLQKDLLQNGITHITLDEEQFLVTHRKGFAW
jgi:hypothetical protein